MTPRPAARILLALVLALSTLAALGSPATAQAGGKPDKDAEDEATAPSLTSVCSGGQSYSLFHIEADAPTTLYFKDAASQWQPVGPLQVKNQNRYEAWVGVGFAQTLEVSPNPDGSAPVYTKSISGPANNQSSCAPAGTFTWVPTCGQSGAFNWQLTFAETQNGGGTVRDGVYYVEGAGGRLFLTGQEVRNGLFSILGDLPTLYLTGTRTIVPVTTGTLPTCDQDPPCEQTDTCPPPPCEETQTCEEPCEETDSCEELCEDGSAPVEGECPGEEDPCEIFSCEECPDSECNPTCEDTGTCEQCSSSECNPTCEDLGACEEQTCEQLGTCPPPPAEECGNGLDDDGDGQIDEGCTVVNPPPPPAPAPPPPPAPVPPADTDDDDEDVETPPAGDPDDVGDDRIETAVLVSQDLFPAGGATNVVLARSDVPADAIASTPFSVAIGAPLLLTPPTELPPIVADEIVRVLADGGTVFIAGGPQAISDAVEQQIQALGKATERIGGSNRFATATQVADRLYGISGFANVYQQVAGGTVLLADGSGFQDATVAGPAAASMRSAVLLTAGDQLPPETAAWLESHPVFTAVPVGDEAITAAPDFSGLGSDDPYETAVAVAREFFPAPAIAGIATSMVFPDPLVGGVDIAHRGGPLLLSHRDGLATVTSNWFRDSIGTLEEVRIYGGTAALSTQVEADLEAALTPAS